MRDPTKLFTLIRENCQFSVACRQLISSDQITLIPSVVFYQNMNNQDLNATRNQGKRYCFFTKRISVHIVSLIDFQYMSTHFIQIKNWLLEAGTAFDNKI